MLQKHYPGQVWPREQGFPPPAGDYGSNPAASIISPSSILQKLCSGWEWLRGLGCPLPPSPNLRGYKRRYLRLSRPRIRGPQSSHPSSLTGWGLHARRNKLRRPRATILSPGPTHRAESITSRKSRHCPPSQLQCGGPGLKTDHKDGGLHIQLCRTEHAGVYA